MSTGMPEIHCETVYPTLCAPDVQATVAYYRDKLGFEVEFLWGEPPEHAGVRLGSVSLHLSCNPASPHGASVYFVVEAVDDLFAWYRQTGADLLDQPANRPWGMREFNARDLNGYNLRFGQHDPRAGAPMHIERTDLNARIEKRLVALLADLAQHKGMTVGETLEETLLHSFETLPGVEGVASPHTRTTHAFIAQLKQKHGLDYDTHDSYRFTEE